jgi:thiol:disulfide interchange protein DsbD
MPRSSYLNIACILFLLQIHLPAAEPETIGLDIQLVSEVTHIQPGTPFQIGLHIRPQPGYHTYWQQPGIVGVPTSMKWDLPRGWKVTELQYPEPDPVLMHSIKAQGFKRDVILQATVTPPSRLTPAGSATVAGKAVWMCCSKTCHPGYKNLSLTLPVLAVPPSPDPKLSPLFEAERRRFATTTDAWSGTAQSVAPHHIQLTLTPSSEQARILNAKLAANVRYFTGDGWIDSDDPHRIELHPDGKSLLLTLPISKGHRDKKLPKRIHSLLQLDGGWTRSAGGPRTISLITEIAR